MKSVAFLRNTWKKKDSKGLEVPISPNPSKVPPKSRSRTATADDFWQYPEPRRPSSPTYDQITQGRDKQSFGCYESSQTNLSNATYSHGDLSFRDAESHRSSRPSNVVRSLVPVSPTQSPKTPSSPSTLTLRETKEGHLSDRRPSEQALQPSCSPSSPSFRLLPPLDLNYGPGSKLDSLLEGKTCKCVPPTHSKDPSLCPRNKPSDWQSSVIPTRMSADAHHSLKTARLNLDLSHDPKRRTLYHSTGSTPHLPCGQHTGCGAESDASIRSGGSNEAELFPLSLFPLPPPLIVRKKVPAPLILRSTFSTSAQSSRDSSPVKTPTISRQDSTSPFLSNIISPTKKPHLGRSPATFSPPSFSPPNSPLPKPPIPLETDRHLTQQSIRPLRMVQSHANLRDPLPFPAMHRLTSSEPISEKSVLQAGRTVKQRPAERPRNAHAQAYLDPKVSNTGMEARIEWGYAL